MLGKFDPICHLEVEKPKKAEEEVVNSDNSEDLNASIDVISEDSMPHKRKIVIDLHKIWLRLNPGITEFINMLDNCFKQGMECLKVFERWSKHIELQNYANVLETWDDKVCEQWEPPEDNDLNCDQCLSEEPDYQNQQETFQNLVQTGFHRAEVYMKNFQPFLDKVYDNDNIDFDIIFHEHLKDPNNILPLVLQRFNTQIDEFEEYLPEHKDLGLLRIDFTPIKK